MSDDTYGRLLAILKEQFPDSQPLDWTEPVWEYLDSMQILELLTEYQEQAGHTEVFEVRLEHLASLHDLSIALRNAK